MLDVSNQLSTRPPKAETDAPQEPLNILVMGSDTHDGAGNNIDGLTGDGARSDTTILMHLSADREHAYGVSIPRDSLITRPDCKTTDGETIPGGEDEMWNAAFALGGPRARSSSPSGSPTSASTTSSWSTSRASRT